MAVCDASYRFTFIEVGAGGREGDTNAFTHSKLGKAVLSDSLEFPGNELLNGISTPYFMVGNDVFPLISRLMKPYGSRKRDVPERIFNHRLNRARRCIDNAFGILCAKWMAVQRTQLSNPDTAQKVVAACCSLHNFVLRTSPADQYLPKDLDAHTLTHTKYIRDNIKKYVNSSSASLQNEAAEV
ncbi:uncharacterized protein LOC117784878 [Drosophila innubila]|uniref:uncharacterized protein LOC117784878 n=1 Tax=Drosophila innubila TaxID=198719 RepID=UPI00148C1A8E|nr:uncharacterized protein LOC117784878 [Drosophila innubila]